MDAGRNQSDQPMLKRPLVILAQQATRSDQAYEFLASVNIGKEEIQQVDITRLKRKIDWRIIPVLFLTYVITVLDKVALNYAQVMRMDHDIGLEGNEFSNVATALFAAYLVAEIPNIFVLNKVPVAKWLGANVVAWGIATACTAAATSYHTLLVARIFLGVFEASVAPSLALISSQYYTRSEHAVRVGLWGAGAGIGHIIGGFLSFGFQHVHNASIAGWRLMFIVLGVVSIFFGCVIVLFVPDTPMTASFLTNVERAAILDHTASNQTGIRNGNFKLSHLRELIFDFQIWALVVIVVLSTSGSGVITSYSATLIKDFGFTPPYAALLNTPSGLVATCTVLMSCYGIRYTSHRWAWIVGMSILALIGACLMSFLPNSNRAGLLAGIYLVNASTPVLFISYQWTAANVAGYTKRVVATVLMSASFGVGNLIGPQTFRAKEAPEYRSAKIALVSMQSGAALVTVVLFLYYVWQNRRRDARSLDGVTSAQHKGDWDNLTDKENSKFRYVY